MDQNAAYEELLGRVKDAAILSSMSSLLNWDEQTYMPPAGAAHRGNQLALLAGLYHERLTHPRIGELLDELSNSDIVSDPIGPPAVNVRETRRKYRRMTRLPRALVEEFARTVPLSQQAWRAARKQTDFSHFRPWLEKIVTLKRREAEALFGDDLGPGATLYDALLDEFEPNARAVQITALFSALREELVPLVTQLTRASRQPNREILRGDFPVDRQRSFCDEAAAALGFDAHSGRLDIAAHPFCSTIGPGDFRITTRYKASDFSDSFFSVLHEVGHSLYEQGLDPEQFGTPMGEAVSLGIHESQSRLWENSVGRSRAFWAHFLPRAQRLFPDALGHVSLDAFHFAVNEVEASAIRVEADEVTYNLHIIVRFELEQAMLSGELPITDLPRAWNEKYQHYLGITPTSDAEGCLQDVHWSEGAIGYFPTYTLGNLFAAQLFAAASRELGDLDEQFARGEFTSLLGWLRDKVHRHGHRYAANDLVQQATGEPPSHVPFVTELREKLGQLYGL